MSTRKRFGARCPRTGWLEMGSKSRAHFFRHRRSLCGFWDARPPYHSSSGVKPCALCRQLLLAKRGHPFSEDDKSQELAEILDRLRAMTLHLKGDDALVHVTGRGYEEAWHAAYFDRVLLPLLSTFGIKIRDHRLAG